MSQDPLGSSHGATLPMTAAAAGNSASPSPTNTDEAPPAQRFNNFEPDEFIDSKLINDARSDTAEREASPRMSTLFLPESIEDVANDHDDLDLLVSTGQDHQPVASTSQAAITSAKRYAGSFGQSPRPKKRPRMSAAAGDRLSLYQPPPLPHYTVVRSSKNSRSSPHVIRIHDNVTDGSASRWPPPEECQAGHKVGGKENWYDCQPRDVGRHKAFREKLGEELSKKLGLAEEYPSAYWVVEDLPKGHLFTVHHCCTASNQLRADVYIFGSAATSKFRTVNEFVPHLYWLLAHGPGDGLRCECKYCTKKTQSEVNRIVGLADRSSSVASGGADRAGTPRRMLSASGSGSGLAGTRNANGAGTATARVAKAGDPGTEKLLPPLKGQRPARNKGLDSGTHTRKSRPSRSSKEGAVTDDDTESEEYDGESSIAPMNPGYFSLRQRDEDLKDVSVPRQAEVVWVKLPRALLSRSANGERITHWPAIVRAREFVVEAEVLEQEAGSAGEGRLASTEDKGTGTEGAVEDGAAFHADTTGALPTGASFDTNDRAQPQISLSANQRPVVNVGLLGISDELRKVPVSDVLPWLAHTPPTELLRPESIMHPDSAKHVWDGSRTLRVAHLDDFKHAEDAATAIALACQIVAYLVNSFSPGEKFAMTPAIIAHHPDAPPEQAVQIKPQAFQVWGYQSIYFGGELIWPGDIVRLLPTDVPGPSNRTSAAHAGGHDVLLLRVALIYQRSDSEILKLGGDVWTLEECADGVDRNNVQQAVGESAAASTPGPESANGKPGISVACEVAPVADASAIEPAQTDVTNVSATPEAEPPAYMPHAPAGYRWKQVSVPGTQTQIDLECIGGRVHPLPRALDSREKIASVRQSFALLDEAEEIADGFQVQEGGHALTLNDEQRAFVLAGLKATVRLYMKGGAWCQTRFDAVLEAERHASEEVGLFFKAHGQAIPMSRKGSAAA